LRSEYQAHVVIALVLVKKVLSAVVERYRLALEAAGAASRARLLAGLLDFGEGLLACCVGGAIAQSHARLGDGRGDVFRRHQHIAELGGATPLRGALRGHESAL